MPEEANTDLHFSVFVKQYAFDGDKLNITLEIDTGCRVWCEKTARRLVECHSAEDIFGERASSEIVVYYPDEDETLFDVAKLHRVPVSNLAEGNGISIDTYAAREEILRALGIKRLLIT